VLIWVTGFVYNAINVFIHSVPMKELRGVKNTQHIHKFIDFMAELLSV